MTKKLRRKQAQHLTLIFAVVPDRFTHEKPHFHGECASLEEKAWA